MIEVRRWDVLATFGALLLLAGIYSGHDWTLFFMKYVPYETPEMYSRFFKFFCSLMCALLAFRIGKDTFDKTDSYKLMGFYGLLLLGDIIHFFDVHSIFGAISFAAAHTVLLIRHIAKINTYKHKMRLWILLGLIEAFCICFVLFVLKPNLEDRPDYWSLLLGYAVIVGFSLWGAWANYLIGYFPRANSRLIAIGVFLYFLSDVCVGLYRALPFGDLNAFFMYLTWIPYLPALFITALSGYNLQAIMRRVKYVPLEKDPSPYNEEVLEK